MVKVAIVDQSVSAGGVERFIRELVAAMLRSSDADKFEITVLLRQYNSAGLPVDWPSELQRPNLHVRYLLDGSGGGEYFKWLQKPGRLLGLPFSDYARWLVFQVVAGNWIEKVCRREKYDIVYFPYPYDIKCPKLQAPIVATFHDFNFKHTELGSYHFLHRLLLNSWTPPWFARCYRIMVDCDFTREEIRKFFAGHVDKVQVVRLGVPTSGRIPEPSHLTQFQERNNLPRDFLFSPAWICTHKNQALLVEALGKLKKKGTMIPVVFTGPNSEELSPDNVSPHNAYVRKLRDLIQKNDLVYRHDYFCLGFVNEFEMDCLYRLASALVSPSLYEGFGLPVLEATKAGCPVICSDIPPYVEHNELLGDSFLLFDPRDSDSLAAKVEQFLSNRQLVKSRTAIGAGLLDQNFSWQVVAGKYMECFEKAVDGNQGHVQSIS